MVRTSLTPPSPQGAENKEHLLETAPNTVAVPPAVEALVVGPAKPSQRTQAGKG